MKKGTSKAASETKETKESKTPERVTLKWLDAEAIHASMRTLGKNGSVNVFDLVERQDGRDSVTLTIFESDRDFDNCKIDIFGFVISAVIRAGKSGMFLSLPSQKGKDGNYYDIVSCFDKNFHATIKAFLKLYYEG